MKKESERCPVLKLSDAGRDRNRESWILDQTWRCQQRMLGNDEYQYNQR